jgi:hypothetical protein
MLGVDAPALARRSAHSQPDAPVADIITHSHALSASPALRRAAHLDTAATATSVQATGGVLSAQVRH